MAYRSATPGDTSSSTAAKSLSNLGVTTATGTEATVQFLSGIGEEKVELNFLHICPDFPTPQKTIFPLFPEIMRAISGKLSGIS